MRVSEPPADEPCEECFKPLTAEDVKALQRNNPALSPWQVIKWQVLAGLAVTFLVWLTTDTHPVAWSSMYGVACVVVPAIVFARGLQRQHRASNVGSALGGFFVWEMVKVVLTMAMLFAAPRLVTNLNWLALLAGFVVTMKVYWVAMWWHSSRSKSVAKI